MTDAIDTAATELDRHNALYDAKLRRERARDAVVEAAVAWGKSDTRFASLEMLETSEALCAAVRAYLEAKGERE